LFEALFPLRVLLLEVTLIPASGYDSFASVAVNPSSAIPSADDATHADMGLGKTQRSSDGIA